MVVTSEALHCCSGTCVNDWPRVAARQCAADSPSGDLLMSGARIKYWCGIKIR